MEKNLSAIKNYNDLRKHFTRETFQLVMNYIAWQNRLSMTPIVTMPQAIGLATAIDSSKEILIDEFYYAVIKDILLKHPEAMMSTENILQLSEELRVALRM